MVPPMALAFVPKRIALSWLETRRQCARCCFYAVLHFNFKTNAGELHTKFDTVRPTEWKKRYRIRESERERG